MLTKDDIIHGEDGDGYAVTVTPGAEDLPCNLTKVTSTNDGRVTLTISIQANTPEMIAEMKGLLSLQRGECVLSLKGIVRGYD